ncbi:hypothetical protein O6H91_05G081500 [Diphasiastrum complanatum]|uniref:Uncharacterized protein n=2 Tax=Diphasiastrum complanatum TaxID=34168 RepID=A0ACC2DQK2_DIPCM|nr:hypothetical protein O6H91_Y081800 [Diphasiastrum complanatum]KAJ7297079.1 hypothetical protein O6H91_Y081800 [Diphasiastrum complanatum]KAJ7556400.1 hypothetical protein O6H91_05G081500 [Diphasiastrum complanatum]KAJ7556401.1 hypothetical protein O6H91_05G081500 [Diphasiastrum complanatum]
MAMDAQAQARTPTPTPTPAPAPAATPSSVPPPPVLAASREPREAMEDTVSSIEKTLALLHQLHCSVSSFSLPSQLLLLERLNGVVKELMTMQSSAQECNLQIPIEVVSFIDEGRNPDEFTKGLLNNCIQRNQSTRGKVDSFKSLRKHLLEEIEEAFPEETDAYRMLRTAALTESRSKAQGSALLSNGDVKVKSEH